MKIKEVKQLSWVEIALTVSVLITCSIIGSVIWMDHLEKGTNFIGQFDGMNKFGDKCEISTGIWNENSTFESIFKKSHTFTKQSMPYRGVTNIPHIMENGYLITRCFVDLTSIKQEGYAAIHLGNVFGTSGIFVNGTLKMLIDENGFARFPLNIKERIKNATVTIISKRAKNNDRPGLASMMPLVFTDDRDVISKIEGLVNSFNVEMPIFRLGFALALMITFGICWIYGIRYPDVTWMIIVTGILTIESYVNYIPRGTYLPWELKASGICRFSLYISFAALLLSFMRIKVILFRLEYIFLALVGGYAAIIYSNSLNFILSSGITGNYLFWLSGFLFLGTALGAFKTHKGMTEVRRKKIIAVGALSILAAAGYITQAILIEVNGTYFHTILNFGFASLFAGFLSVDLVVFHRKFFEENASKIEEQNQKKVLEDRLELGKTVQKLLFPKELKGKFHNYSYTFYHFPCERLTGDWMQLWNDNQRELHIFMGDVVGKGVRASLIVSTIITVLNDSKNQKLGVGETIRKIARNVSEMYLKHATTTLAAASFSKDTNRATLYNLGGVGWFLHRSGKTELFPIRNQLIGADTEIDFDKEVLDIQSGDLLFTFTDGFLEGGRMIKKMVKRLEQIETNVDAETIFTTLNNLEDSTVFDDDKTMIVVTVN